MTIAEVQPYVEQALIRLEWDRARQARASGLLDEQVAIHRTLQLIADEPETAVACALDPVPLRARLDQIADELEQEITPDLVPVHPIRSVPMDMITVAVLRRILRVSSDFPILAIRHLPPEHELFEAVRAVAAPWRTANGAASPEPVHLS